MRIRTHGTEIVIDLIDSTNDIGELVKLAIKLGYESHVENAEDRDVPGLQVRLTRDREWKYFGEDELTGFAILVAFVRSKSGSEILEVIRRGLEDRHFPPDKPIQDVMAIAAGPDHEGHDH